MRLQQRQRHREAMHSPPTTATAMRRTNNQHPPYAPRVGDLRRMKASYPERAGFCCTALPRTLFGQRQGPQRLATSPLMIVARARRFGLVIGGWQGVCADRTRRRAGQRRTATSGTCRFCTSVPASNKVPGNRLRLRKLPITVAVAQCPCSSVGRACV